MSDEILDEITASEYKYGFTTAIESDTVPPGLNEDVIRLISAKKNEPEWMLEWRLDAYKTWLEMTEPEWHERHLRPNRTSKRSRTTVHRKQKKDFRQPG
jgi:Fe-S cluster assembly protein SufB